MKRLLEKRNVLIATMEEMLNQAERETRALDIEEYENHEKELEELNATIQKLETRDKGEKVMEIMGQRDYEMELRAITSSTHGEVIPEELHEEILKKIKEKSQVYAEANSVNYVGDLAVLIDGEDGEASILEETEKLTESDLGNIEKVVLRHRRVATLVTVSKHMVNNSPLLTLDFIADKVASRVDNTVERQIFNASGKSKEMTSGLFAKGTKSQGDISIENIMSIVSDLKTAYLKESKFYCNRETFQSLVWSNR